MNILDLESLYFRAVSHIYILICAFLYSQQNRNLRDKMKSESTIVVLRNGSGKSLMLLHLHVVPTYSLLVLDFQFRRITISRWAKKLQKVQAKKTREIK